MAGYFARWSGVKECGTKNEPNPIFGKKTDDYPIEYAYSNESLAPWIFMISKGGLTVPTNQFLLDVDKMDQAFNTFHGVASFDKGSRIIDRFTEELVVLFAGKKHTIYSNSLYIFLQDRRIISFSEVNRTQKLQSLMVRKLS